MRNRISRLNEFRYESLELLENSTKSFDTHKFLAPEFSQYFGLGSTGVTMSDSSYEKLISNEASLHYFNKIM